MSHTSLLTEDDVLGGRYRDRARAGWFAVGAKPIALFGSLAAVLPTPPLNCMNDVSWRLNKALNDLGLRLQRFANRGLKGPLQPNLVLASD